MPDDVVIICPRCSAGPQGIRVDQLDGSIWCARCASTEPSGYLLRAPAPSSGYLLRANEPSGSGGSRGSRTRPRDEPEPEAEPEPPQKRARTLLQQTRTEVDMINSFRPEKCTGCRCSTSIWWDKKNRQFGANYNRLPEMSEFIGPGTVSVSKPYGPSNVCQTPTASLYACANFLWNIHESAGHGAKHRPTEAQCEDAISKCFV